MPQLWLRNAITEGIGTFALTFVALVTISSGELATYALGQGLMIMVLIAALGHVSGGHFNPAVTLGVLLAKRIDLTGAVYYWAAQLIGGLIAALTVLLVLSRDQVAAGAPTPLTEGDLNLAGAVLLEAVAVFVVVVVVFGTVLDERAPLSVYPFAIGLAYAAGIFAIGGLTEGALNPARALGPAVVGGEWAGLAAWFLGPLIGAVLAWLFYEFVVGLPPAVDEDRESVGAVEVSPREEGQEQRRTRDEQREGPAHEGQQNGAQAGGSPKAQPDDAPSDPPSSPAGAELPSTHKGLLDD